MEPSDAPPQEQGSKSRLSVGLAAGAVSVLVLALLGYALSVTPTLPPQLGSPVPDFQLTAMDGRPLNLSELQGKVIILNFFASWCNPCRQEATDLSLYARPGQPHRPRIRRDRCPGDLCHRSGGPSGPPLCRARHPGRTEPGT